MTDILTLACSDLPFDVKLYQSGQHCCLVPELREKPEVGQAGEVGQPGEVGQVGQAGR